MSNLSSPVASLKYIPGLDGLRAFSVLLVIFFHFISPFAPKSIIARTGWVGVDIFFVISGYLIAKIWLTRKAALNSKKVDECSWRSSALGREYTYFLARRARRLLPVYAVCVCVFCIVAIFLNPNSKVLGNLYLLLTMTSNIESSFGDRHALGDNLFSLVHFWSLAVEWHFYLIFPLLFLYFQSIKKASTYLVLLALLTRLCFFAVGLSDNATYSFSFCRFDSLALGALIAAYNLDSRGIKWEAPFIFGAAVFLILMLSVYLSSIPFKSLHWLQTFGYTVISASIGLVVIAILRAPENSLLVRVLELRGIALIGRASYSIYAWHLVFFPLIMSLASKHFHDPRSQMWTSTLIAIIATTVLSSLSYLLVEKKPLADRRYFLGTLEATIIIFGKQALHRSSSLSSLRRVLYRSRFRCLKRNSVSLRCNSNFSSHMSWNCANRCSA